MEVPRLLKSPRGVYLSTMRKQTLVNVAWRVSFFDREICRSKYWQLWSLQRTARPTTLFASFLQHHREIGTLRCVNTPSTIDMWWMVFREG
uniref:Uncharacterized protein n=1 Tax=Hyaloperonospora arabidopsidis (strain Emoy2) TaxID=559515 RepID=M4C0D4_HYAAE